MFDAFDIVHFSVAALTSDALLNEDIILTRPGILSSPDVAILLSQYLERLLSHTNMHVEAWIWHHQIQDLNAYSAVILAGMNGEIAQDSKVRLTECVLQLTGKKPGHCAVMGTKRAASLACHSLRCVVISR